MAKKSNEPTTFKVIPKVQRVGDPETQLRLIRAETPKQLRDYLIDGYTITPATVEDGMKAQELGVQIESAIPAPPPAAA